MASVRKRKISQGTKYTVLYDYEGADGVRRQKSAGTFDTSKEAEAIRLEIDLKKNRNTFIAPSPKTVEDFIYQWLPIRAKNKKWEYSTLFTARGLLEKHVIPEIGAMSIQAVTPINIEMLFAHLEGKKVDGPKSFHKSVEETPYLSGSTLSYIYTLVKCFFDAAVTWKIIPENPVTLPKPERNTPESVIWDLNMTLTALDNIDDAMLHLLVHMASAHTFRNGEMCGLTWDVIDFDKGMLKVDKTMQRVNKKVFDEIPRKEVFRVFPNKVEGSKSILILKTPKTKGSIRWLYLTRPILQELRHRQQMVAKNKLYYGDEYHDYNLVFCQDDGTPVEPNLTEKWFRLWQRRHDDLGLPQIKMHGLRHSSTTLLLYLSNADLKTVQSITGHGSAKMVLDVYSHPLMSQQRRLVDRLEQVMYSTDNSLVQIEGQPDNLSIETVLIAIRKNPLLAQEVFAALHAQVATTAELLAR